MKRIAQIIIPVMAIIGLFGMGALVSEIVAAEQTHKNKDAFHAEVAHALFEMNTTLDMIEAFRAEGSMPPDKDARHEKAAHGFKHALELFGVKVKM